MGHQVTVLAPDDPEVVPGWQETVNVKRVRFMWPRRWSRLGHARSLESDIQLKWHAYPLAALFSIAAVIALLVRAKREASDVIHANWLLPGGFIGAVASRLTGIPLVVSLHGSDVFVAERYRIFRPLARFVFRQACHLTACSTNLAQRAVALGLPPEQIEVVPYGVALDRYAPDVASGLQIRDRLGLQAGQPVAMVMGRLVHKKGFAFFIRALPAVLAQFPDARFIIGGEGDLRSDLLAQARELGVQRHVIFTGHIPWNETPAYLAAADVVLVPSILDESGNLDGLPNVLLESLAAGRAIIATDVAGIPEVITNEENGLLVPQKDPEALAQAMCRLFDDPAQRRQLGNAARATATAGLGWERISERVAGIFAACIQERHEKP